MMDWDKVNALNPTPPEGKVLVLGAPPDHQGGFLVVGEAPGKEEVLAGEPFVGRAGQLLRKTLEEWGVRPVYFTNACLWRPADGAEDVKPTQKEIAACLPRLWALIAWYRPKRILAVGAVAASALFKFQKGVTRRGVVKPLTVFGHTYAVWITHHPAYPLYEPDYWIDFYEDVGRFAQGDMPSDAPTAHVEVLSGHTSWVALDTEMTSVLPGQGRLLCAAACRTPGQAVVSSDVASVIQRIPPGVRLVGHNSITDEVALRLAGHDVRFREDTLLYHYAHDERTRTHSLKTLAPVVARVTTYEDLIAPYMHDEEDDEKASIASAPEEILHLYNARDADVTLRLWDALREKYNDDNQKLYEFLMRVRGMLVETTLHGLMVDRALLDQEISRQEARVQEIAAAMPINPNSHEQVLRWLREAGYTVADTREETLRELEGDVPARILAYREEAKTLDAFLRPLQAMGDVIRPSYKIHGTETGRLSCHDPNIQQFPERLKRLIVAWPGNVFVGWDFSQLEIRVQAWLCGDPLMRKALLEGVDFHQRTGDLLGIDRQSAKRLNFLIQYGGGAAKASRALGISRVRAAQLIDEYYRTYAGLKEWKARVTQEIIDTGRLTTPYGRRRHFDFLTDDNLAKREREGHNFLVQSLSSDINLDVALCVYERTQVPPLLLVHDFAAFEVPAASVDDFIEEIRIALREVLRPLSPTVPIVMSVKVGPTWGDMKEVTTLQEDPPGSPT